jgi:hypothetical protein
MALGPWLGLSCRIQRGERGDDGDERERGGGEELLLNLRPLCKPLHGTDYDQ